MATIYFVERCLYASRLKHLKRLADNSSIFILSNELDDTITHIVADSSSKSEVLQYLSATKNYPNELLKKVAESSLFLNLTWFVECMRKNSVIEIESQHLLSENNNVDEPCLKKKRQEVQIKAAVPSYACQRRTPLKHFNTKFTTALEILEEHALLRADVNSNTRALAFRRGSAVLKSLPYEIQNESDLQSLPYIDSSGSKPGHCKRVIMDILENGFSSEVDGVKNSEYYKVMKTFCGIFGVGPQTAQKWYREKKLKSIDDVQKCNDIKFTRDQYYGLAHYDDLNTPVPKATAEAIRDFIFKIASEIEPGIKVELVGGFRRGKTSGHDVDLLISHAEIGKEKVLSKILKKLEDRFIYTDKKQQHINDANKNTARIMDNFEKAFTIFKFFPCSTDKSKHLAVRVDLIVVPIGEFSFAILGWTGSKLFERELRRYAKSEKEITLTSHGMFFNDRSIPASTEREIFKILDLNYVEACDRNC